MSNPNEVKIDEGATYEYLRHGFVVIIISIPCFILIHWTIGLLMLIIAVAIFAAKTGIIIDIKQRRVKKYSNLLGYKSGKWIDLSQFYKAELILNSNRTKNNVVYKPLYIAQTPGDAKTFDLIFWDDAESPLLFNQFLKFTLATKTIEALRKIETLTIENRVQDSLINQRKRARR